MRINVYEIIGEFAMAADAGEKLSDKIYTQLQQDKSISLDFTGVKIFTSTFLNIPIGQLLCIYCM